MHNKEYWKRMFELAIDRVDCCPGGVGSGSCVTCDTICYDCWAKHLDRELQKEMQNE